MGTQHSTSEVNAILARARGVQAAYLEEQQQAQKEAEAKRRQDLDDLWQPIVDNIVYAIKWQLDDQGASCAMEQTDTDGETGAVLFGNGWTLYRPAQSPHYTPDYEREYRPMKLYIDGIYTPVMCWNSGLDPICAFAPADIRVDDEETPPTFWVGGRSETRWDIERLNHDLLLAIARAADKEDEYIKKFNYVYECRNAPTPAPEPSPTPDGDAPTNKIANLEAAGAMLGRFVDGDWCLPNMNDIQLTAEDNAAFLIAAQIHALAVEVGKLHDTLRKMDR